MIETNEAKLRGLVTATGRELLSEGLVARTWGNVSCRIDADSFLITPSGLDYTKTTDEDIVKYTISTGKWKGKRKPSSEKGIHAAAYKHFPETGFVIHTHQTYASAIGLAGLKRLSPYPEERELLGGIALADYGLPGTKKLRNAVSAAMDTGAHVILMFRHGALICARDQAEAMEKARVLEAVCRRAVESCGKGKYPEIKEDKALADSIAQELRTEYPLAKVVSTDALLRRAATRKPIHAQLDDMAQMIGASIPVVKAKLPCISKALDRHCALLVPKVGAIVCGRDEDDTEALAILADKAAVCALHTAALHDKSRLPAVDIALMNFVYKKKYSKKKEG